jgi:hypothetical protein
MRVAARVNLRSSVGRVGPARRRLRAITRCCAWHAGGGTFAARPKPRRSAKEAETSRHLAAPCCDSCSRRSSARERRCRPGRQKHLPCLRMAVRRGSPRRPFSTPDRQNPHRHDAQPLPQLGAITHRLRRAAMNRIDSRAGEARDHACDPTRRRIAGRRRDRPAPGCRAGRLAWRFECESVRSSAAPRMVTANHRRGND